MKGIILKNQDLRVVKLGEIQAMAEDYVKEAGESAHLEYAEIGIAESGEMYLLIHYLVDEFPCLGMESLDFGSRLVS